MAQCMYSRNPYTPAKTTEKSEAGYKFCDRQQLRTDLVLVSESPFPGGHSSPKRLCFCICKMQNFRFACIFCLGFRLADLLAIRVFAKIQWEPKLNCVSSYNNFAIVI